MLDLEIRLLVMLPLLHVNVLHQQPKQELSSATTYEHNLFDERYALQRHRWFMTAKFDVFVVKGHEKLQTLYLINNVFACSSLSTTTELSIFFTSK